MSKLMTADSVQTADVAKLQSETRRRLLDNLLSSLNAAKSLPDAITALGAHHVVLDELGLFDDAARMRAFTKAVHADVSRILREAEELAARAGVSPAAQ